VKGDDFIERKIIIGLIVSTDYIREVEKIWNPLFLESEMARMIAVWCLDYFRKYRNAPRKDIEGLYVAKMKEGLSEQQSEFIEAILQNLSHEYERGQFNEGYLLDQTRSYFQEQQLRQFAKDIEREVSAGQLIEAERLASSYRSLKSCEGEAINPFTVSAQYVRKVFEEKKEMLIRFPKELGEFWNTELVRGAFVALMAPEKHGKTFLLLELALRAMATGCHVAFFQGGDMSEKQQFYRICTYLTKKPGKKKHTNGLWVPKVDCLYNQLDTCRRAERECDFGVFHDASEINFENLVRASTDNPEYKPCRNCKNIKGSPWLIWKPPIPILPWKDAFLALRKWGERYKREFKLDTYANDTLMISDIRARLDTWERQEGFVPDVIIVDYADGGRILSVLFNRKIIGCEITAGHFHFLRKEIPCI